MTAQIEILHPASAANARIVLFDFDGTLSLIRTGWLAVMVPMMVEELAQTPAGESQAELSRVVEDFVWRLTGQDTIYQMIALADEIRRRGGEPLDPLVYKQRYLDRLWTLIGSRVEELRRGGCPPEKYLVPGARPLLESLRDRGLTLYLASGTDEAYMREEADLLDLSRYFAGVHGAREDHRSFSKRVLIERILATPGIQGNHLLAFGDGYVEIEEVKQAGGVAVGVATDEPECQKVNEWKRRRLTGVGADYIIPNFLDHKEILNVLF